MMLLYHGSNMRIEEIDLAKSRPNKDFAKAFQYAFCIPLAISKLKKV